MIAVVVDGFHGGINNDIYLYREFSGVGQERTKYNRIPFNFIFLLSWFPGKIPCMVIHQFHFQRNLNGV